MNENDHKVIGKELDLFTFSDTVGKGLPLWTPKGSVIRREIERFIVDEELKRGYLHIYTPDIAKLDLYEKSGHYPYYKDSMYSPIEIEDEKFMLRPMSCPHHFELFLSRPRSYRELPMRLAELAKLYRFEQSGELMGLQRVRSFCLSDAHIITQKERAQDEIAGALELIEYVAHTFGLVPGTHYHYRLSLGDRNDAKKYYKDDAKWDHSENVLREVLKSRAVPFVEASGEAAFYGPKIDIQMKNANGKEDTAFTVQYDFVMPERFDLHFINEKGENERPVVIHRSSVGAIERIIAFLIEFYKGAFPVWIAPIQVKILPVSDKHTDYAVQVEASIKVTGVRTETDSRNETLGAKIRDAEIQKVPYILIVGDKEIQTETVSVRKRGKGSTEAHPTGKFIEIITEKIANKSIEV